LTQENRPTSTTRSPKPLKKLGRGLVKNAVRDLIRPGRRTNRMNRELAFRWFFDPEYEGEVSYSTACEWASLPMERGRKSVLVLVLWDTIYSNSCPTFFGVSGKEQQEFPSVHVNGGSVDSH